MADLSSLALGIPDNIPEHPGITPDIDHAPDLPIKLQPEERALALRNALRYFPEEWHPDLVTEFVEELSNRGRIRMMRFRPTDIEMRAHSIDDYPASSRQAAAIMMMIQNNLDPMVAQYPEELITYGGNGSVFQNWAQYRLTMAYLSRMSDEQTLVIYSGHPLGLFPSSPGAPRLVVTNGMVIPNHSSTEDFDRMHAMGVTQYGQMTAGSYMYIGPQGIVHGTTITLLNAARRYLSRAEGNLRGITYVTSGLGGMSGAQAKAAVIAGASSIIAEVNPIAAKKRLQQGWLMELTFDLDEAINRMICAADEGQPLSIGYVGNVVDLWERLVERDIRVDLGSDQTSLHNPSGGGYIPVGYGYDDAMEMLSRSRSEYMDAVSQSLKRQVSAIDSMSDRGMKFWDYGNAFLLEAERAGCHLGDGEGGFRYPSYVEDIMGPMCFDLGFGPFRWVCCSGAQGDLDLTDSLAEEVLKNMVSEASTVTVRQIEDNLHWIKNAGDYDLVVGSQARILYADSEGRRRIAKSFHQAIRDGRLQGPVVLGRDHHDVSGTDSPYRETANIRDGSMFTADMSVHNFVGDAVRGATWVSLHNGGGVGWGEVINGGFGLLLDGSDESMARAESMLAWDVDNGVARRAWARNEGAIDTIRRAMQSDNGLEVTIPNSADDGIISMALERWIGE